MRLFCFFVSTYRASAASWLHTSTVQSNPQGRQRNSSARCPVHLGLSLAGVCFLMRRQNNRARTCNGPDQQAAKELFHVHRQPQELDSEPDQQRAAIKQFPQLCSVYDSISETMDDNMSQNLDAKNLESHCEREQLVVDLDLQNAKKAKVLVSNNHEMEIREEEKKLSDENKKKMKRMKTSEGKKPAATPIIPPTTKTPAVPPSLVPENKE